MRKLKGIALLLIAALLLFGIMALVTSIDFAIGFMAIVLISLIISACVVCGVELLKGDD